MDKRIWGNNFCPHRDVLIPGTLRDSDMSGNTHGKHFRETSKLVIPITYLMLNRPGGPFLRFCGPVIIAYCKSMVQKAFFVALWPETLNFL